MSEANISIRQQSKAASSSRFKKNLRKFVNNKLAVVGLIIVVAMLVACVVAFAMGVDYRTPDMTNLRAKPDAAHLFGTDTVGRDLLSRVLVGGCYSIFIGVSWGPLWVLPPAISAERWTPSWYVFPNCSRPFPSWCW